MKLSSVTETKLKQNKVTLSAEKSSNTQYSTEQCITLPGIAQRAIDRFKRSMLQSGRNIRISPLSSLYALRPSKH